MVPVIGPEMGVTQPGKTIVCGDSHTSTHGAFGALAFGIGTTEVGHVLATQCLLQRRPRTLAVNVQGDRKSTRLNSSHSQISYAVFCLKKKNITHDYSIIIRRNHILLHAAE